MTSIGSQPKPLKMLPCYGTVWWFWRDSGGAVTINLRRGIWRSACEAVARYGARMTATDIEVEL